MKKALLSIGLCLALIMGMEQSHAQSGRLSIGLEAAQPMGDFGDGASTGFGGSVRYEFPMGDKLGLMATAGYITFSGKDDGPSVALIPVQLGAKFYFKEQQAGLYVAAHVGMHMASFGDYEYTDPFTGQTVSQSIDSETKFSYAPEAGFHMSKLDIGLRYQLVSADEGETELTYLGLRIAFVLGGE